MNGAFATTLTVFFVVLPFGGFAADAPETGHGPKNDTPVYSICRPEFVTKSEIGHRPKSDTLDVASRGRIALTLNKPIKISVSSPESRPYGATKLRSIWLHEATFRLDEQSRLVVVFATSDSPVEPGYRSHGDIHVAVFDDAKHLLGTARKPYEGGGGVWSAKPVIGMGNKINFDFGASNTYKSARFFEVTITENPVPHEQR